eukprot:14527237-Alexandrium_andersonii.AAC.1
MTDQTLVHADFVREASFWALRDVIVKGRTSPKGAQLRATKVENNLPQLPAPGAAAAPPGPPTALSR